MSEGMGGIIRKDGGHEEVETVSVRNYEVVAAKLATPEGKPDGIGLVLTFKHEGVADRDRRICIAFPEEEDFLRTFAPMVEAAREVWPVHQPKAEGHKPLEEMGQPAKISMGRATRGLNRAVEISGRDLEQILVLDENTVRVALMSAPSSGPPSMLTIVLARPEREPAVVIFEKPSHAVTFGRAFCEAVNRLWPPRGRPAPPEGRRGQSRHRRRSR